MTAKTLPELTAYIQSRIRAYGRNNGVYEWDSCVDLYASDIEENPLIVRRVLRGEERPTTEILKSLIGHMGITSVYETSTIVQCDKCKRLTKEYLYVIKTISREQAVSFNT